MDAPEKFYVYLKNYATEINLIRHLTGSDYTLETAKEAILETVEWRNYHNIDNLTPKDFERTIRTNTVYCLGYFFYFLLCLLQWVVGCILVCA